MSVSMYLQVQIIALVTFLFANPTFSNRVRPDEITKWKDATVPYKLLHSFNTSETAVIFRVFAEIAQKTCVKFLPASDEVDFVRIQKGPGCNAALGKIGGTQVINLQGDASYLPNGGKVCVQHGIVAHQVMHTLGFYPEHLRPDRDHYVTIVLNNVKPNMRKTFEKHQITLFNLTALPYDYNSITHGELYRYSWNNEMTIIPALYGVSIGQRDGLSEGDIQKIRHVYCTASKQTLSNVFLLLVTTLFYYLYASV